MSVDDGPGPEAREILRRVEAAEADELARILARPTESEARVLRPHFGEERYRRMRRIALEREEDTGAARGFFDLFGGAPSRPSGPKRGGVVMLPGLMGSGLTVLGRGEGDPIWLSYWRIAFGRLERLRLAADGVNGFDRFDDARPDGALKRYYGELQLALARSWDVRTLAFDWRKDINRAADELADLIRRDFRNRGPVHLVAHSMGGLVARVFIRRHPRLWEEMRGGDDGDAHVGRLVMLGTPNHGSHLAVQALTGLAGTVRSLGKLDQWHSIEQIRQILATFPGLYQLLPSPKVDRKASRLFDAGLWRGLGLSVPEAHLEAAEALHRSLDEAEEDRTRMLYVAGAGQETISGILDYDDLGNPSSYEATTRGDGSVTHRLGLLDSVRTFFVEEEHSALTGNPKVLGALDALLLRGDTNDLAGGEVVTAPQRLRSRGSREDRRRLAERIEAHRQRDIDRLEELLESGGLVPPEPADPAGSRSATPVDPGTALEAGRQIEDMLVRGFLGGPGEATPDLEESEPDAPGDEPEPPPIEIRLRYGGIEEQFEDDGAGAPDAVAVGRYLGMRPSGSEEAIDRAISGVDVGREGRLLTQLAQRGVIRGGLGQPFFLENARTRGRLLAVVGMGEPGRCGAPELAVVVRELCWALGRLGRAHLASVLIGAGDGNLTAEQAVDAWLRGLGQALRDAVPFGDRLRTVTFIEHDPARVLELRDIFRRMQDDSTIGLGFELDDTDLDEGLLGREYLERSQKRWDGIRSGASEANDDPEPVRLAVTAEPTRSADGDDRWAYRFSALTSSAAVPERVVPLDRALVDRGNDRLAALDDERHQRERGRYLEELLFPDDLRKHLIAPEPLVIQLDRPSARIHWEMLVQPLAPHLGDRRGNRAPDQFRDAAVLGLSRSLTRQLRATFAPPPEPPPPARRHLRVLIVADPADDAPLPGAQREGLTLAEMFGSFDRQRPVGSENTVEVRALVGPGEATRTAVLSELLVRRYDVLHFAGHCQYVEDRPDRSGWVFSDGELISARELTRIDRVPSLVVSNACESGVTRAHPEYRDADLAPNFAEAVFARGVHDFICTAWPVDDRAALTFATVLYRELLGLPRAEGGESTRPAPQPMHRAMHRARHALLGDPLGRSSWGAYQHYGNPFSRLFAPS